MHGGDRPLMSDYWRTLKSRTCHPVWSVCAYRALGNMLWRRVCRRILNEVRPQHPVVSKTIINTRYSESSSVHRGASPGSWEVVCDLLNPPWRENNVANMRNRYYIPL